MDDLIVGMDVSLNNAIIEKRLKEVKIVSMKKKWIDKHSKILRV